VAKNYEKLKLANPQLPLLVRECSGVTPKVTVRYGIMSINHWCEKKRVRFDTEFLWADLGVERAAMLSGMNADAVGKEVEKLVGVSGK